MIKKIAHLGDFYFILILFFISGYSDIIFSIAMLFGLVDVEFFCCLKLSLPRTRCHLGVRIIL